MSTSPSSTNHKGLIYCNFNPGQNQDELSFCWLKLFELLISACFITACCFQLYKQIKAYGCKTQWRFFAIVFMIASLLANIFFCLWNDIYTLYTIQSYFYSLYYLTIVGYVFRLYMRKNTWDLNQRNNQIFIITIILLVLLQTAILIDALFQKIMHKTSTVNQSCQQTWYLCVNVSCLFFCLVALIMLYCNQKQQKEKFLFMSYEDNKVRNPFMELWCWIGFNTLAQLVNLVESGLLLGTTVQNQCLIVRNSNVGNNILRFFFSVFTLTAGYAATLVYFRHVRLGTGYLDRIKLQASVDRSEDLNGSYGVQLFNNFLQNIG